MATDTAQLDLLPQAIPEGEYRDITIDTLKLGFGADPEPAMVESIKRFGILQPVIVEERSANNGVEGHYRVLDGRRRVLSAQALGHETVPAFCLPEGSVNPHVVQLASHALRSRNRSAEVDAIEQLFKDGAGERDIADATGLRVQELRTLLPLIDLSPTMRQALREGKIVASVAAEIVKLPASAQRRLEDRLLEKGKVTMPDVREQRLARTQQAVAKLDLGEMAADVPDLNEPVHATGARLTDDVDGDLAEMEHIAALVEANTAKAREQAVATLRKIALAEMPEGDWYPAEGDEQRAVSVVTWAQLIEGGGGFKSVREMRAWLRTQAEKGLVVVP